MAMGSAIIIKLNDNVLCFLFPTLETSSFIVNLLEGQNTDDISVQGNSRGSRKIQSHSMTTFL